MNLFFIYIQEVENYSGLRLVPIDGRSQYQPQGAHMPMKNLVLFTVAVTLLMALVGTPIASTQDDDRPPSSQQVASAKEVSDLMLNELLAALFKEFDETTPENADHGKQAISLIFNDLNRDMRLVGTFRPPLGKDNNRPSD